MSLSELPLELFTAIIDAGNFTTDESLILRLVNRDFYRLATPNAFKTIRLSDFTRTAFDRLVDLSQTPLAGHVTTFEYKLIPFLEPRDNVHAVDALIQLDDDASGMGIAEMARELFSRHEKYLAQVDVLEIFFDIISLAKALPAFPRLRSIKVSRFEGNYMSTPLTFGRCQERAFWAVSQDNLGINVRLTAAILKIVKATQRCDPPIEEFLMETFYQPLDWRARAGGDQQVADFMENLTSLSMLNLPRGYVESPEQWNYLKQVVIDRAQKLETLRIGITASHDPIHTMLLNMMTDISFRLPHLKTLEIATMSWIRCDRLRIVRLLQSFQATLKRLELRGLVLERLQTTFGDSRRPWQMVAEELSKFPQLETVRLERLGTVYSAVGRVRPLKDDDLRTLERIFTGKDERLQTSSVCR